MKTYRHIFFDLDHTLWDYEKNAKETLVELHRNYDLEGLNINSDAFIDVYKLVNAELWRAYNSGQINKDELREIRFYKTLGHLGTKNNELSRKLEDSFLDLCPTKSHVLPNTFEILEYLSPNYDIHIITNGFSGSTEQKLASARIDKFINEVITSESIGVVKPQPEIFHHAMSRAGANKDDSIMVGDNVETDIKGAINAELDHIYYNPHKKTAEIQVHIEIRDLIDLKLHL